MMTGAEREAFALRVMKEVRRWPGVQIQTHLNPLAEDTDDGVEFRLHGRQIGHIHHDCAVHLPLTRALKETVIEQGLAEGDRIALYPRGYLDQVALPKLPAARKQTNEATVAAPPRSEATVAKEDAALPNKETDATAAEKPETTAPAAG